ncbi:hypothetical protein [Cedecea sp.]|jgi:hypothetical protein|uniref:hypothetical protein n=1 Tax=Cedecea sp. TaxID=1970739 RepID=UPI002F3E6556
MSENMCTCEQKKRATQQQEEVTTINFSLENIKTSLASLGLIKYPSVNAEGDLIHLPTEGEWMKKEADMVKAVGLELSTEQRDIIQQVNSSMSSHVSRLMVDTQQEGFLAQEYNNDLMIAMGVMENKQKLFWSAKTPCKVLPYFPRFFALSLIVLHSAVRAKLMLAESPEVSAFLANAADFIARTTGDAAHKRMQSLSVRLAGPYNEMVYLFDTHTESSLTSWVEFDAENAARIQDVSHTLKPKIAREYLQNIGLESVYNAVACFDEREQSWEDMLDSHVPASDNATRHTSENTLILPGVIGRYVELPASAENYNRGYPQDLLKKTIPDAFNRTAATMITKSCAQLAGKAMKLTCSFLSTAGIGLFLGPFADLILGMIFPPNSLTMEDVKEEIRKQVGEKISNHNKFEILKWLDDLERYKTTLAAVTKDYDETPSDNNKSKRSVARKDYYDAALALSHRFFSPDPELEEFAIHYKLAPQCMLVMGFIYGAFLVYLDEDHNNNLTKDVLNNCRKFINDSWQFLDKVYNQAFDRQGNGIRIWSTNHVIPSNRSHWVKDYTNNNDLTYSKQGNSSGNKDTTERLAKFIDYKSRTYALEATGIYNAAMLHHEIVLWFNDACTKIGNALGDDFNINAAPSALDKYNAKRNWFIYDTMKKPNEDASLYKDWFKTQLWRGISYGDNKIEFYDDTTGEFINSVGMGECRSLHTLFKAEEGKHRTAKYTLPYGVRAELFTYDDEGNEASVGYLPSNKNEIGKEFRIGTNYWTGARFFIDLEFYYDGLNGLNQFTTEKGKWGIPLDV